MAFGAFTVTRSTTKWVLNSAGVLSQVAINTPAFEFNTDGTYRGLLVEPAATNLILQSADFGTTWTTQGAGVTTNTSVAPNSLTTADTLTGDGTNTTVYINQSINFSTAGTYTFSFWAKAGTHDIIRVNIANYVGSTSTVTGYNLTTGTTTQATNTITAFPNGWYRISFTFTIDAGDLSGAIRIFLSPDTGTTAWSVAGDANTKSIVLWGAQLETGSVATSYIPTVASTVTRTADSVTLTGASSLIGQTEGTVYCEFEARAGSNIRTIFALSDGTTLDRIRLRRTAATTYKLERNLTSSADITSTLTGVASSGVLKAAAGYSASADGFILYINGTGATASTGNMFTGELTNIAIGMLQDSTNQTNGWIRSFVLLPSRLANATLATLTT